MLLRLLPRFREADLALPALEARETWSRGEIEAFQLERLNAIWGHAVAHVPHYRRLGREARLPARIASLEQFREFLPVLPKAAVRDEPRAFLSERAESGRWCATSGSTGPTTRVYWGRRAHRETLRAKYRLLASWDVDFLAPAVFLWGSGAGLAPGWDGWVARLKQPLTDWLRNRLRLSAYHLGHDDLRGYLRRISRFRPTLLYSYGAAAYLLAREAEVCGFDCAPLRLTLLSGERIFPHFVTAAERAFGAPAVQEYGSMECGFLAGDGPDRRLRVREDVVLLETLPREDGRYDIVVSVLTNPSFPLLRYAIGDVTDAPLEVPTRGFSVLKNVTGRDNDLIISRAGRLLHPNCFDGLFECFSEVRRWQIHQKGDGSLWIGVELVAASRPPDLSGLKHTIGHLVEGYPVEMELVPRLASSAGGKHTWIRSDMSQRLRPAGAGLLV